MPDASLQAVIDGSPGAADAFVRRVWPVAIGISLRFGLPVHLAEEAAQEALLSLLKGVRQLRIRTSEAALVATTVRNACYHIGEREARHRSTVCAAVVDPTDCRFPNPHDESATQDEFRHLRQAIAALSEILRPVIELYYLAGLSHEEIAGALGIPVGTAKSRHSAALKNLRTLLTSEEEEQ